MKLFLLSQTENSGYDTYDSMVVAAEDEESARMTLPGCASFGTEYPSWAYSPAGVTVAFLGTAKDGTLPGVILASFNAG